jgi:hypothetical protein
MTPPDEDREDWEHIYFDPTFVRCFAAVCIMIILSGTWTAFWEIFPCVAR